MHAALHAQGVVLSPTWSDVILAESPENASLLLR